MKSDPDSINIRDNWGERVKIIRPVLDDNVQELGLTKRDVANAIKTSYTGIRAGIFREGEKLVPIVARLPLKERGNVENLRRPRSGVLSPRRYIPCTGYFLGPRGGGGSHDLPDQQDEGHHRGNRQRIGGCGGLFREASGKIGSIPLPAGVTMEWGGEYENSGKRREVSWA